MKTKFQFLLLLAIASLALLSCGGDEGLPPEPLFEGDLVLFSQEAVNEAGQKGHVDITGTLIITDSAGLTPITDLSVLSTIKTISGDLVVRATDRLTSLDGLNNLQEIKGDITIENNRSLFQINALANVTDFSDPVITVSENFILRNLEGLNQVEEAESVIISRNRRFVSLDGLQNLKRVNRWLTLSSNESLTNLDALSGLEYVGDFGLFGGTLYDFSGLSGLHRVDTLRVRGQDQINDLSDFAGIAHMGHLDIASNRNLESLQGLTNLQTNPQTIGISGNNALTNLRGLEFISSGEGIRIGGNENLTSLTGLDNLEELRELVIASNPRLNDLTALIKLEKVNYLLISGNDLLRDLQGLSGLKTAEFIKISQNPNLTNLNGLSNLESLRDLELSGNPSMVNLDGVPNLEELDAFWAENNNSLVDFCGLAHVSFPFIYETKDNAFNPTKEDLANGRCRQ